MSKRPESTARQIERSLQIRPAGHITRGRRGAYSIGHYLAQTKKGSRTITAAAQPLSGPGSPAIRRGARQPWQDESWSLRAQVGEFRFIGDRAARATSMAPMFIARRGAPGEAPTRVIADTGEAVDIALAEITTNLFGDGPATAQAIKRAAQHLSFNGETNLRISTDDDSDGWSLHAHSVQELTGQPGQWKINDGMSTVDIDDQTNMLIRAWIPDPEREWMPDCAARSVLPVARELKALGQHVSAQVDSRLAGAGILLVPEEITVIGGGQNRAPDDDTDGEVAENYDPIIEDLMDSMLTPLQDRESAAAVVPIMFRGPADALDKIRHLTLATPLDEHLKDLRDESIRRLALGMDSAPEILMGTGSANHWGAWQIDEDEIRMVIAPLLATICHALTVGWLQPLVAAMGLDPTNYIVWFDTTPLELRTDRSKDSQALFDKGVVGAATVRRENGFTEDDAPQLEDEERVRALLEKVLMSNPAGFVEQLLPLLGGPEGIAATTPNPAAPGAPAGGPPTGPAPRPIPRPERALPDTQQDEEPTP
ncbi:hypothetical protein TPB0596_12370 [Tsukamurella pulmonis]|uniref:hypothetical protein n=1 Tax=Tsukamurella pulmonis TaxID=47312 RepID=UPI001EDF7D8A|nr:hypothetical protein [Tsukamurella pulmonis]BDD81474.1 hypothetical protein TPB0596_12370 [Tsukamurella pulmonis]